MCYNEKVVLYDVTVDIYIESGIIYGTDIQKMIRRFTI
jgi:hypothetical protein